MTFAGDRRGQRLDGNGMALVTWAIAVAVMLIVGFQTMGVWSELPADVCEDEFGERPVVATVAENGSVACEYDDGVRHTEAQLDDLRGNVTMATGAVWGVS